MFNITGPLSLVVNLSGSPEKHYLNIVSASSHSWHKMVYDSNTPMLFSHLAQATLSCSWNLGIALCKPFTSASSMFKGCAMSTGQQHQVSLRKVGHFHWSKFFMVRCSESHDSFHVWCRICRSSSGVQIGCGIKDSFKSQRKSHNSSTMWFEVEKCNAMQKCSLCCGTTVTLPSVYYNHHAPSPFMHSLTDDLKPLLIKSHTWTTKMLCTVMSKLSINGRIRIRKESRETKKL